VRELGEMFESEKSDHFINEEGKETQINLLNTGYILGFFLNDFMEDFMGWCEICIS